MEDRAARQRFTPELRERAVRLVLEHELTQPRT
jgi:transposase-like protein